MANTRIKDISTAATTLNSDDFIAVDGSTAGTRKMAKADLISEISSGVSGTYLEESNNLSDVTSVSDAKGNLEIPDVGTAPNEVPLNGMLGSMAFQSAEGISVDKLEVTDKVDGNLGINTPASSTHALDVLGSVNCSSAVYAADVVVNGTTPTVTLNDTDGDANAATAYVQFQQGGTGIGKIGDIASGRSAMMVTSDSGKELMFFTNGQNASSATPAITVDTSQRVGIGSAPAINLGSGLSVDGGSGYVNLNLVKGSSGTGHAVDFSDENGALQFRVGTNFSSGGNNLIFARGTGSTIAWKIDSATGNLVANSTGIDFGSGSTLSDYEEGTHTTTATPSSSGSITLNGTSDTLSYTRVGRKVTVSGALGVSAVSSPVGNYINFTLPLQIADLDELSGHFAGSCVVLNAAGSMGSYSIIGLDGESSFRLYKNTSNSAVATAPDFSGDETIYVSVTYFTTA